MSTLSMYEETGHETNVAPAQRLRGEMAAAKVGFCWLGTRKTLTPEQKDQAAESFGAEGEYLSAGKKLLDTKHPSFKAATAVRGRVKSYWKGITLPYPEPGVRLIRQDDINGFVVHMTTLRAELDEAVGILNRHYPELKATARRRLGSLYNDADYPESLHGLFGIDWEFPPVEPPSYLRQLSPALYEQEQQRVAARFEEAVKLAEEAFLSELGKLVSHLVERLGGQDDGRPKIFRDSAITNLTEFFERFRSLNVRSNDQLDDLVARAQRIVRGVEPQDLRDQASLRQHVTSELAAVQSVVDGLLVDRPRRNILRPAQREAG